MIQQRLRTKIFIVVPILLFFSAYGIFSYNLDQILDGDLIEFIEALVQEEQARKLEDSIT